MVLFRKINKRLKNEVDHSEKEKNLSFFKRTRKTKMNDLKMLLIVCILLISQNFTEPFLKRSFKQTEKRL